MHTNENDDMKRSRGIGAAVASIIVLSAAAGFAAIGAQAPAAPAPSATTAMYGVPDASTALDPAAAAEPLPPTF
jgi:hypothetical protein